MFVSSIRRSRLKRGAATLTTFAFVWTGILATPLQAMAQTGAAHRLAKPSRPNRPVSRSVPPASLKENLRPLTAEQVRARQQHAVARRAIPTLLDEVGHLSRNVSEDEVGQWKNTLHLPAAPTNAKAVTHIQLGEYLLAHQEDPEGALWHFRAASALAAPELRNKTVNAEWQMLKSLAAYDTAFTHLLQGRYAQASGDFRALFACADLQGGFNSRNVALLWRHADACTGYHQERRKAGITEPIRLDPYCGMEALAACLRGNGQPYDKQTLQGAVHMTGFGSTMADIVEGARKLGMSPHRLTADDMAIKALPKPLIAYVEHDHFVAMVDADKNGVTYLCSDCGVWPGGRRQVTWKQWRMMEASEYLAVVTPGSTEDGALASLTPTGKKAEASGPGVKAGLRLASDFGSSLPAMTRLVERLRGHAVLTLPQEAARCGFRIGSLKCAPIVRCPMDGCPICHGKGPSAGEPVNLATLEEEYTPEPDLEVYNPTGPAVVWSRTYNSFGNDKIVVGANSPQWAPEPSQDFGQGWSQPYDVAVYRSGIVNTDGTLNDYLMMPNGARIPFRTSPVTSAGTYACTVAMGYPYTINKEIVGGATYFRVINTDGTQLLFQDVTTAHTGTWYSLIDSYNIVGRYIKFQYDPSVSPPRLSAILSDTNLGLLTIVRDGSGYIQQVHDCYNREILYHVGVYQPTGATGAFSELDQVSQIGTYNQSPVPANRYNYGYQAVLTNHLSESFALLHTITVPSPTGAGTETATINYATDGTAYVTSIVDANNNKHAYAPVQGDANHTQVTITSPQDQPGFPDLSYRAGFNSMMSQTDVVRPSAVTQGQMATPVTLHYGLAQMPFCPDSITAAVTTSLVWWDAGNINTITPSGKYTTIYGYDTSTPPRLSSVSHANGTTSVDQVTQITYTGASRLPSTIYYPVPGHVNDHTVQNSTSIIYDTLGNVTSVSSGNAVYQANTTLTSIANYTNDGTDSQTAALGQPMVVSSASTNGTGQQTHFRYDAQGRVTRTWDADFIETDFDYNLSGQPLHVFLPYTTDLHGAVTGGNVLLYVYLYDGGPLTQVRLYDANGNIVRQTTYIFGHEGETLGVQELGQSAHTADTTYDGLYRVKTVADGNNHQTLYRYNDQGLVEQVLYPDGRGSILYTYDEFDHPSKITDQNGYQRLFTFHGDDLYLVEYRKPDNTSIKTVTNTLIDGFGRVKNDVTQDNLATGAAPAYHWHVFAYDDLDNVLSVVNQFGRTSTTVFADLHLDYTYWPTGDVSSSTLTNFSPGSTQAPFNTSFSYTDDGKPSTMNVSSANSGNFSASFGWQYYANGWLNKQTEFKSNATTVLSTTYTLNELGQVKDLINLNANGLTLSQYTDIAYDPAGNHKSHTEVLGKDTFGLPQLNGTVTYQYDTKDQILSEQKTNSSSDFFTNLFSYDNAGNIGNFSYNTANQLTSSGAVHDPSGNQTTVPAGGATYAAGFDPDNHLTSFGNAFTSGYYADGSRMWKQVGSSSPTYFLYDGGTIPVCEFDGGGNITAVNTTGPTGLLSRATAVNAWNQTFYAYDWRGNTVNRLDGVGNLQSTSTYRAYGVRVSNVYDADPYDGFGGQFGYYKDIPPTGSWLYLCGARHYSPDQGRWITRDPIGYGGGINLYSYAGNNPINGVDPSGLDALGGFGTLLRNVASLARGFYKGALREGADAIFPMVANPNLVDGTIAISPRPRDLASTWSPGSSFLPPVGSDPYERLGAKAGAGTVFLFGMLTPECEAEEAATATARTVVSRIGEQPALVREAEAAGKNQDVQRELDRMLKRLAEGHPEPGMSSTHLFSGVHELRGRGGARIYIRRAGDTIQVLGKSSKANQPQVIRALERIYK